MRIVARCHPDLEPILPKPVKAADALPDWFRQMPGKVPADTLGGGEIRTVKQCPPFLDALSLGLLIPLPTDLTIADGALSWDWDLPPLADAAITRAPVGLHVPEQTRGAPVDTGGRLVLKFISFWTLEVPPGWSLLFTHPFNRPDLPFTTLTGVVDCDLFRDGYVHFPALLDPGFSGVIAAGTPVAQVVPVQRGVDLEITAMTGEQVARNRHTQEALQAAPGVYRKDFRR